MAVCIIHLQLQTHLKTSKQNAVDDGLSCHPHGELSDDLISRKEQERVMKFAQQHLQDPENACSDQHTIKAISECHLIHSPETTDPSHALILPISVHVDDTQFASAVLPKLSATDIAIKQKAESTIQHVTAQLGCGEMPPLLLREQLPLLLREVNKLELCTITFLSGEDGWDVSTRSNLCCH